MANFYGIDLNDFAVVDADLYGGNENDRLKVADWPKTSAIGPMSRKGK